MNEFEKWIGSCFRLDAGEKRKELMSELFELYIKHIGELYEVSRGVSACEMVAQIEEIDPRFTWVRKNVIPAIEDSMRLCYTDTPKSLEHLQFCLDGMKNVIKSDFNRQSAIKSTIVLQLRYLQSYLYGAKKEQLSSIPKAKKLQREADELIHEFVNMNKLILPEMIDWIGRFQPYTDSSYVLFNPDMITVNLIDAGYKAGECSGDNFIKGDKEIEGRYIVGQAIEMLQSKVKAIHPLLLKMIEDWQKAYVSNVTA